LQTAAAVCFAWRDHNVNGIPATLEFIRDDEDFCCCRPAVDLDGEAGSVAA